MSAAAPSTTTNLTPVDIDERKKKLDTYTAPALKEQALRLGIDFIASASKFALVDKFARNDDFMAAYGWFDNTTAALPTAGNGDIDANGDAVGSAIEKDADGFPTDSTNVPQLHDDELLALVRYLADEHGHETIPGDREGQIKYVVDNGYEKDEPDPEDAANTLTEHELAEEAAANSETDAEHHRSEFGEDEDGQLTLVPGGEAPAKSVLNIGSLRHDLGVRTEFKDGDRIRVSFEIEVDKISFLPEKSGGEGKRRVRTHAGPIDKSTVEVSVA